MSKRKKLSHKQNAEAGSGKFVPTALPLGVLAGALVIAVVVFIAYLPSINGGFVLDDDELLTKNDIIKSSDGLYRFWCTSESIDYWPVTNTSFWIEWRLWGMNPAGYHVSNLILHVVEALLVWLILRKLCIPGAFLAAVIFAVHPVNVESVAWIAQRKNTMAMLFFLLSILCYLKFETQSPGASSGAKHALVNHSSFIIHRSSFYWISLAAFIVAMLSKGSVAVLPVILLGILLWSHSENRSGAEGDSPIFSARKLGQSPWWDLARIAPFFAVAVVLAVVNVWFQTHGQDVEVRDVGFLERLLGAGGVVWFYLSKAIIPIDLAFVYPQWRIEAGNPQWWLPLVGAIVLTVVLWCYRNTWSRPFLFAWGFFCASLVPVMGFVDVGFMKYSLVADRYQHIAVLGVISLVSAGFTAWRRQSRGAVRRTITLVAVIAIGSLVLLTWRQSALYRDAVTLYQAALIKNPDCSLVQNNLGNALGREGQLEKAIEHLERAVAIKPNYSEAHSNLAGVLVKSGRPQEAIPHYKEALQINPDYTGAHYNFGIALVQTGRPMEAIEHFEKALRLKPDYAEAHNNLGITLLQTGRSDEAIGHFQEALTIKPDHVNAYKNLALAYAGMHRSSEAVGMARKAIEYARLQGQTAEAGQIENWLNSYEGRVRDERGTE